MTRKDYVLISKAIRESRFFSTSIDHAKALDTLTTRLITLLTEDNPNFDRAKFLTAAEYGKLPRESEVV